MARLAPTALAAAASPSSSLARAGADLFAALLLTDPTQATAAASATAATAAPRAAAKDPGAAWRAEAPGGAAGARDAAALLGCCARARLVPAFLTAVLPRFPATVPLEALLTGLGASLAVLPPNAPMARLVLRRLAARAVQLEGNASAAPSSGKGRPSDDPVAAGGVGAGKAPPAVPEAAAGAAADALGLVLTHLLSACPLALLPHVQDALAEALAAAARHNRPDAAARGAAGVLAAAAAGDAIRRDELIRFYHTRVLPLPATPGPGPTPRPRL